MEHSEETIKRLTAEIAKLQCELASNTLAPDVEEQPKIKASIRKLPDTVSETDADDSVLALRLQLSSVAKSSGGDKYLIDSDLGVSTKKDRFIYVPQTISRRAGKPSQTIEFEIRHGSLVPGDAIAFTMIKAAKGSGDDRYTPKDKEQWEGDIYLPKSVEGSVIYLIYMAH
jgi:hypothetical protein